MQIRQINPGSDWRSVAPHPQRMMTDDSSVASNSITHHRWQRCGLRSRSEAFTRPPQLLLPFLKTHRRNICQNTNSENLKGFVSLCFATLFLWYQMGNYRWTGFCLFCSVLPPTPLPHLCHTRWDRIQPRARCLPCPRSKATAPVSAHVQKPPQMNCSLENSWHTRFIWSQHYGRRPRSFSTTVRNHAATHNDI